MPSESRSRGRPGSSRSPRRGRQSSSQASSESRSTRQLPPPSGLRCAGIRRLGERRNDQNARDLERGKWMRNSRWLWLAALVGTAMFALTACGGDSGGSGGDKDKVTLQSKWVVQAQFAGYYAALDQGYYDDENLDVTIRPGGPDIIPEQVVLGGQA